MADVVLKVIVLGAPIHLGESFDYLLPKNDQECAGEDLFGYLVSVKFGAQRLQGVIVGIADKSDFPGKLKYIEQIISATPVLTPELLELYSLLATYYGTRPSQVIRQALPNCNAADRRVVGNEFRLTLNRGKTISPSHPYRSCGQLEPGKSTPPHPSLGVEGVDDGGVEVGAGDESQRVAMEGQSDRATSTIGPAGSLVTSSDEFSNYENSNGSSGRMALSVLPGIVQGVPNWVLLLADVVANRARANKSVLLVLPDEKDLSVFVTQLAQMLDESEFAVFNSTLTDRVRYTNYLRVLNGQVKVVVGTRMAALAPLADVDVCIIWNDQDTSHKDSRAPYMHSREILLNRQSPELIIASYARSAPVQRLVEVGYLADVHPKRDVLRANMPKVVAINNEEGARIPSAAYKVMVNALQEGPVLVMSPKRGYIPLYACNNCREIANCTLCGGGLRLFDGETSPRCPRCGQDYHNWHCSHCNGTAIRSVRVGSEKLAEEIGRSVAHSFKSVVVRSSSTTSEYGVLQDIDDQPQIIIATPNAEPLPAVGYRAVIILDAHIWTVVTSLEGTSDTLSLWFNAVSLALSAANGGTIVLVGNPLPELRDALVRYDSRLVMQRELQIRHQNHLPPFARCAVLAGDGYSIEQLLEHIVPPDQTAHFDVLGPFELDKTSYGRQLDGWTRKNFKPGTTILQCFIIRVHINRSRELAKKVLSARVIAGAEKTIGEVKILLDPRELL
jgi:primosomal protein N' (replication factor Y)